LIDSLLAEPQNEVNGQGPQPRSQNQATVFSNHDEAVGAVAPELLDKAVFPIEIGLHGIP
jgi:hypothetical protein